MDNNIDFFHGIIKTLYPKYILIVPSILFALRGQVSDFSKHFRKNLCDIMEALMTAIERSYTFNIIAISPYFHFQPLK